MDLDSFTVVKSISFDFERQIYQALMTKDDNYLFLSDRFYGEVLVLDTRSNTFSDTLRLNAVPGAMALVNKNHAQTGVEIEPPQKEIANAPRRFSLSQNYPNPWNLNTTIRFDIPASLGSAVKVRLCIYNMRGQLIRELVNEVKKPGSYSVIWDGENDRGIKVASGIYFYELRAGRSIKTKKMVVVK